jgi:transposase
MKRADDTSEIFSEEARQDQALLSAELQENARLREENAQLKRRIDWFNKQLFGQKSERRLAEANPHQPSLLGAATEPAPAEGEKITVTYERGKAPKQRADDCVNDSGLRFGPEVPVQVIEQTPPELTGPDADQYEVIGIKTTHRLAQQPASYVVQEYRRPVLKRKGEDKPRPSPAPANVLDKSIADVSFLVGMLVDKFQFHLPLYRQHQRLGQAGITLSRATLTNLCKRTIELLRPIAAAQLLSILQSRVLAMDETPIKAGKNGNGKMKQGYFWPLYGERDEMAFTYSASRGRAHIEKILKTDFTGTLLSDGYTAYARFVEENAGITHAQCWVHSRRYFIDAEQQEPQAVRYALDHIARLYKIEEEIAQSNLNGDKKHAHRLAHSKPVVDQFFQWCQTQLQRTDLIPSNPFTRALGYVIQREHKLRVFLEDPDLPLDTNHLERALRPIPMGRKNWLFCWTELGAEHVGIIQSLITTCKLHDINPYTYLTDVLLRIDQHPAKEVVELTPRIWKEKFADNPLRSDIYGWGNDAVG